MSCVVRAGEYGVRCHPGPSFWASGFIGQAHRRHGHTEVPSLEDLQDWAATAVDHNDVAWSPWQSHVVRWANGVRCYYKAGTPDRSNGRVMYLYDLARVTTERTDRHLRRTLEEGFGGCHHYSKAIRNHIKDFRNRRTDQAELNKLIFDTVCEQFKMEVEGCLEIHGADAKSKAEVLMRKEERIYEKSRLAHKKRVRPTSSAGTDRRCTTGASTSDGRLGQKRTITMNGKLTRR